MNLERSRKTWIKVDFLPEKTPVVLVGFSTRPCNRQAKCRPGSYIYIYVYIFTNSLCMQICMYIYMYTYLCTLHIHIHITYFKVKPISILFTSFIYFL